MLRLFYTANLCGQLDLLPRLASFLRSLRATPFHGQTLLIDAGDACMAGVQLCDATDGRAALMVMDAIGYDAANVSGYLSVPGWQRLAANNLHIALADALHPQVIATCALADEPPAALPHRVHIALRRAADVALSATPVIGYIHTLTLQDVPVGTVGEVILALTDTETRLEMVTTHTMPTSSRPDATIAGIVDFVRDEARQYLRRQNKL